MNEECSPMREGLRHSAILKITLVAMSIVTCAPFIGGPFVGRPTAQARELDEFVRADVNASGESDISDAVFLLGFLFRGGPGPICTPVADANSDGGTDIGDAIFMLGVFFRGAGTFAPLDEDEILECEEGLVARCGQDVFETPSPLGNEFACSHCHSTTPASVVPSSGQIHVAHGVGDVVARPAYFGGAVPDLLGAVNRCRADWMAAPPWQSEDQEFAEIEAFLSSLHRGGGNAAPLEVDITPPATTGPSEGDPEVGCELFARACSSCHGEYGVGGSSRAPSLWTRQLSSYTIREYIRRSGPTTNEVPDTLYEGLLGNTMPFWSAQRLSDENVEDIVAYLDVASDPSRRPCDQVNNVPPAIVRGGSFQTIMHGVRGTAEHWSDGRIVLRNFFYDGLGPPLVLVWLYEKDASDFHAILRGHRISEHMARQFPYTNVTLEFEIPDDIDDEDFNTVAIWCTEFQTNYGEAELRD